MLQTMAIGAGIVAFKPAPASQTSPAPITTRIQTDLEKHAAFGIKRSGTVGDLATADR